MITGRWGKPTEVLLDVVCEPDGTVRGVANPGRENVAIKRGRFVGPTGEVSLEGEYAQLDGTTVPVRIDGHLVGRTLRLAYRIGGMNGTVELVRVEEYRPPRATLRDRLRLRVADVSRWYASLSRPTGAANRARLAARGESLGTIVLRDATVADIPALAALHVETWNRTYRTSRGPTVATRASQWTKLFTEEAEQHFVFVLADRDGRLIGFVRGTPAGDGAEPQLGKIYLRWEYHGLGLGRRMMAEAARRFLARGATSFILYAERSNPTIGFYDRMGGERLLDERGLFHGAYVWRDARALLSGP